MRYLYLFIQRYLNGSASRDSKINLVTHGLVLLLLSSCSYLSSFWAREGDQKRHTFTIFEPYIKSNVDKVLTMRETHYCFNFRQVFRGTHQWTLCFDDRGDANRCFQKISRLQKNRRKQGERKELYRPGEIVHLEYKKNRVAYKNKKLFSETCLAFKIGDKHLIRSKIGNQQWRLSEGN